MSSWLNISQIKDNISSFTREVLTEAGNESQQQNGGSYSDDEDNDEANDIQRNINDDRLRSLQDEMSSMSLNLTSRDEQIVLLERENFQIKQDAEKHVNNLKQHLLDKENELDDYALKVKKLEDTLYFLRNDNSRLETELQEQASKTNDWDNWENNSTENADINKLEMENESLSNEVMMKEIVLNSIEAKMKQISKRIVDAAEFSSWIEEVLEKKSEQAITKEQANDLKIVSVIKTAMKNDDINEFNEESVTNWLANKNKNKIIELENKIKSIEQAIVNFDNSLDSFEIKDFSDWLANIKFSTNQNIGNEKIANQKLEGNPHDIINNIELQIRDYDDDDVDFTIDQFPMWIEKVFNKIDELSIELINENEKQELENEKRINERQTLEELFNEKQNEISMLKVELFQQRNAAKGDFVNSEALPHQNGYEDSGRVGELEEVVNELTARCEALQNELQSKQNNLKDVEAMKNEIATLENQNSTLENNSTQNENIVVDLQTKLNNLQEKLIEYENSERSQMNITEILNSTKEKVEHLNNEILDYENQVETLTGEKEDLLNEIQTLRENDENLDNQENDQLRHENETLQQYVKEIKKFLYQSFIEVEEEPTTDVLDVLRGAFQKHNERAEELSLLKKTIEDLQLQINQQAEQEASFDELNARINELQLCKRDKEFLDGQLQLLTAEHETLKTKVENLQAQENHHMVLKSKLEEDLQIAEEQLEKMKDIISHQTNEITTHKSENDKLKETVSDLQNTIVDLKSAAIKSSDNTDELGDRLVELQHVNTALSTELQELQNINNTLSVELEQYKSNPINETEHVLSVRIQELEAQLTEKASEVEYFQEACSEFETKINEVQNENQQLQAQCLQWQNVLQQTQTYYVSLLQTSNVSNAAIENQNKIHNLSLMLTEKSEDCLKLQSQCDQLNAKVVQMENDTSDMALVREECRQLKAMLVGKEHESRVDETIATLQQENKQLKVLLAERDNEIQNAQKVNLEMENDVSDMTLLREECKQLKQMLIDGNSSQDERLKPLEERCQYLEQMLQQKDAQLITMQNENSDFMLIQEECKQLKQMLMNRDETQQNQNNQDKLDEQNNKMAEVEYLLTTKEEELQNKSLQLERVQQELDHLKETVNSSITSDAMVQSYSENSFLTQVQQLEEYIREKDSTIAQKDAIIVDLQNAASDMNLLHDECRALKKMLTEKEEMFIELQADVDNANDMIQQKNDEVKNIQREKSEIELTLAQANETIGQKERDNELLTQELNESMAQEENIHMLQTEYRNVEERLHEREQELENIREKLFQAETHCNRLQTYEEQFNGLKLAFKEKDEELSSLKLQTDENTILESETVSLLQEELNQLKTLVYEREEENQQLDVVLNKKNNELQTIYTSYNESQQHLQSMSSSYSQITEKVEQLTAENEHLVELLTEKRNMIDKISTDNKEFTANLEKSRDEYHQIANKLEEQTQLLNETSRNLKEKDERISDLQQKVNEASIIINDKETLVESFEKNTEHHLKTEELLKTDLQAKHHEIENLKNNLLKKENELKELQILLDEERVKLERMILKMQETSSKVEKSIDCAKCEDLNRQKDITESLIKNIVKKCSDNVDEDIIKNIDFLGLHITSILRDRNEINSSLQQGEKMISEFHIEKDNWENEKQEFHNEKNALHIQIEVLRKESEKYHIEIKQLEELNEKLKSECTKEVAIREKDREELNFKIKDLESQIFEYKELEQTYATKCEEVSRLSNEVSRLNEHINGLNSERNRLLFNKTDEKNSSLKNECEKLRTELEKSSQTFLQKTKECDEMKLEILKLEEQIYNLQRENKELKKIEENIKKIEILENNLNEKSIEVDHLRSLLEDEQTKTTIYQKDKSAMEAMIKESEKLRSDVQNLHAHNSQLNQLLQEKDVLLKHKEVTTREVEAKTNRELERLRHHLMTIEDAHTQEILESQQREQSLQEELKNLKDGLSKKTIILEDSSKQFQDHVTELEEQLHILSAQRDSQALDISKYQQQLEHNSIARINLQSALEQMQKEKNDQYEFLTSVHQRKQHELETRLQEMLEEQKKMQVTMAEASLAVQGINKLRLELNHKDNELALTKEKVSDLSSSLQEYHEKFNQMMQNSDNKLDKSLIRNLLMRYFQSADDKRADIVQVIGNLLGLSQSEIQQIGNGAAPSKMGGWISSVWGYGSTPKKTVNQVPHTPKQPTKTAPQSSNDVNQSFSELFVKFLEHETESKSNIPSASLSLDESMTKTNLLMTTPSPPDILSFRKEEKRTDPRIPAPGQEIPRVHTHHAQTTLKSLLA